MAEGRSSSRFLTGAPFGCTREFYREWANQDVSEAVFEKSRDPRWRIDMFSVEPPMLSRFADPYDQDVPPAPPTTRRPRRSRRFRSGRTIGCMLPAEGTGYLDLLEYWRRDAAAKAAAAGRPFPADEPEFWQRPDNGRHAITDPRQPGMSGQPLESPAGPAVPPEIGSPFSRNAAATGSPIRPDTWKARPAAPGASPPRGATAPPQSAQPRRPRRHPAGPLHRRAPAHDFSGRRRERTPRRLGWWCGCRTEGRSKKSKRRTGVECRRKRDRTANSRDEKLEFDAHTSKDGGRSGGEAPDPASSLRSELRQDSSGRR